MATTDQPQEMTPVRRALLTGGLPREEEVEALMEALSTVHDQLESLTWRIEGIAESDFGEELDSVIDLSEIGAVTILLDQLDVRLDELRDLQRRIKRSSFSLYVIRREQLARAKKVGRDEQDG
jgi:hypothetical protein